MQQVSHPPKWLNWIFSSAILTGAFLLFQVQPLISKFILPWFGGSPSVWTTCMLFFQVLLFGGYTYAHVLTRLPRRWQGLIHLVVLASAFAFLPIVPAENWKPRGNEDPTQQILLLLGATVGLPYFALSTTSPLVQVWFSRAYVGQQPWRLYALSNAGSLAALLTYPFVFEPLWDVTQQAWLWSAVFVLFGLLTAFGTLYDWRAGHELTNDAERRTGDSSADRGRSPSWLRRLAWLLLPACASLMFLATTNYVCQDIAVVPFLWVIPLSLYLLTFIICFDGERWYHSTGYAIAAALAVIAAVGMYQVPSWSPDFLEELAVHFGMMFLVCMLCHGELVKLRPTPRYLTEFYLLISAGGALGGLFVSLAAPYLFTTFFEYSIGMWAAFLIAMLVLLREALPSKSKKQSPGVSLEQAHGTEVLANTHRKSRIGLLGTLGLLLPLGLLVFISESPHSDAVERTRNFYGSCWVGFEDTGNPSADYYSFFSGSVNHGRQYAHPSRRMEPLAYYGPHTGVGQTLRYFQPRPDTRVGVLGTGMGILAAYAKPGHYYRFYEINPEVIRLAREHFTFLEELDRQGIDYDIILGDARLALEREEPQQFDVLSLDAFSGDSIPMHLVTKEAFEMYLRHLKPDGVIVAHVTNTYLNLTPVLERVGEECGLKLTRIATAQDQDQLYFGTDYVMLTRNDDFLSAHPPQLPSDSQDIDVPLWTDAYHNLFQILKNE